MKKEPTCQTRESADDSVVAELIGASKVFKIGAAEIVALDRTDLKMNRGEVLLIIGPSGSGKTTLLSLFGCVLYPTQGHVCIKGVDTKDLNERQLAHLRRTEIGFVFQNFNLIDPSERRGEYPDSPHSQQASQRSPEEKNPREL